MDVHLLLSATIKVVNMEHKKKKITMGFALLLCAMVALVGVGYALAYQGSATNPVSPVSGETITVSVNDNTGIFASPAVGTSIYTLNTINNGTNFTLNTLKVGGGAVPGTIYDNDHKIDDSYTFKYTTTLVLNDDAYGDSEKHYSAYEVGSITIVVRQTEGATATDVTLSITDVPSAQVHQYGMSLVYVKDDAVVTPGSINLDMATGGNEQEVTLKAYLVWSETVPVASYDSISAFSIASATVTATAVANTPA